MPAPKPIRHEASKRYWRRQHGNGLREWLHSLGEARKPEPKPKVKDTREFVAGPFYSNREMSRALRRRHHGFVGSTPSSLSAREKLPASFHTHMAVRVPEVKNGKLTGRTRLARVPRPVEFVFADRVEANA